MLRLVCLTLLLRIWSCSSACVTVGLARNDDAGIDFTVKTAICSTLEEHHWMVADQAGSADTDLNYCNSSDLKSLCPHNCNFVVRPIYPKAFFACVHGGLGQCGGHNVKTPWPNHKTHICEACTVANCKSCASPERCDLCFEGFFMSEDHEECIFDLDRRLNLIPILGSIIGVLLLIIFLHLIVRCWTKAPAAAKNNLKAVRQGRKHRHFCKVQDWNAPEDQLKSRYPLCMNLHTDNICGVGMALYYNNILFQMYVAAVCFIVTYVLDTGTGIHEYLERFEGSFSRHYEEELSQIAEHHAIWLGALWIILFVSSLVFARVQLVFREYLDSITTDMEDYVLCIKGLPKMVGAEVKEADLREDLERSFRKLVPDVQLHGVSIAYDFYDRRDEVERVMGNFVQQVDVDAGIYKQDLLNEEDTNKAFLDETQQDAQTVREWFSTKPLSTTGEVFAVFDFKYHEQNLWMKIKENNRKGFMEVKLRNYAEPIKVRVRPEVMDPPTVFWWALGLTHSRVVKRCAKVCMKIAIAVMLVAGLFFYPLAHFVIGPFANTGNPPSAGLMLIAGLIMGILYGQFMCNIAGMSHEIGFHRKDSMDVCIFAVFSVVVSLNALFQMGITLRGAIHWPEGMSWAEMFGVTSLRGVLQQPMLVRGVYAFLMPGIFFMPKVMEPLGAGLAPYCLNQLFAHIVYIWDCFPGPLGTFFKIILPFSPESKTTYHPRNAEKALDPMEIPLPFVYADNMLVNNICFGMMMFLSDSTHALFAGMMIWSVFIYCFSRWAHLRFNKRAFFTTNSLDKTASYAWGLPLSVLAMSWSSWVLRISGNEHSPFVMLLPFMISLGLWFFCYHRIMFRPKAHYEEQDMNIPYDEARRRTIYSWFNTNPIYVLKSHYCHDLVGKHVTAAGNHEHGVRYFQVGKEYQCMPKEQQQAAIKRNSELSRIELEWYLDKLVACLEKCCKKRKLCCVVEKSQDQSVRDVQGQQLASRSAGGGSLAPHIRMSG